MLLKKGKSMGTPEFIRQITDSRRKSRERIEQEKLQPQKSREEVKEEERGKRRARELNQVKARRMFYDMRMDCIELLQNRGTIRKFTRSESRGKFLNPFGKRNILETSISDEKGEEVKVDLFSSGSKPAEADIYLVVGALGSPIVSSESGFYLKFGIDFFSLNGIVHYQTRIIKHDPGWEYYDKREPNIDDARKWQEVINALKAQSK
jgi:hypothetical protein